ncbi:hypothetical protein [Phaeobacter sp. C3_T13_0]|uniref:hypothetical protein n=1 Tax=Phaeobacter cretensis TaxID=3342641 RepID=UPI0039BC4245
MAGNLERAGKLADLETGQVAHGDAAQAEIAPLLVRIEPILEKVDQFGITDAEFDMQAFTDEMWGG